MSGPVVQQRRAAVRRRVDAARRSVVTGNLLARVGALVALTITSLLLARTAGPAAVGAFALLRLLPWLTGLALSGGIYAAAPYFLSGPPRDDPGYRSTLPTMAVLAGLAGGGLWAAATPAFASRLFPEMSVALVAAAGVSVLTQLVESTAKACSQGSRYLAGSNLIIVLEELLFIPWYGVLLLAGAGPLVAVVFALPLGDVSTASIGWLRLRARGYFTGAGRPSLARARRIAGYGIRAEVGSIMTTLNARLDFAIVGAIAGPTQLGIYAIASRYAELLRLPSLALNYVLYPAYARAGGAVARADARRALARLGWVPAVAAVPMAALAPVVLSVVYGSEFHSAAVPACVLLVGLSTGALTGVITAFFSGAGRPGVNSAATGAGLVMTLALDLALIPRFGILGASAASTVAYLTTAAALLLCFRAPSRDTTAPAVAAPEPAEVTT